MISVAEAKKIISENTERSAPEEVALEDAAGLALANDIYAPVDIPAYTQSSMDGYAISYKGWKQFSKLKISGVAAAGSGEQSLLSPEHALRIFTGAALPQGADTIVIQERVKSENGELFIKDDALQQGDNVRAIGSEVKAGTLALPKDSILSPPAIGFLAAMGVNEVQVYPLPSVSIIVTGNELQDPGKSLKHGQVYETNSYSLKAVLRQLYIKDVRIFSAKDTLEELTTILKGALEQTDIVLLTGGVSVGDYDFVLKAAEQCGIKKIFHKIKQKPGKPIFFGKKDRQLIFGLPGNPASVLTCFYEYILLALEKMTGQQLMMESREALLESGYKKPAGLTHFLKGVFDGKQVHLPEGQESYKLNSFAKANCLVVIPEAVETIADSVPVEIHLLP